MRRRALHIGASLTSMTSARTVFLLVVATALWGANFNLAKHVFPDFDAPSAAALRFVVGSLAIWAICLWQRHALPRWRDLGVYSLLGFIGIALFNGMFFYGLQFTSASNGALIMGFNPLLTALLAALIFGVTLKRQQLLAMPIGAAGVGFVVLGGGTHLQMAVGDLWILLGCLCWALYNVLGARLMPRDTDGLTNTASVMTAGALALTIWALWQGNLPGSVSHMHWGSGLAMLGITLGGTVLSYIFWNQGLAQIGAPRAAIFMNLVPVTSLVITLLEGHVIGTAQWIGGAAVIGAVMLANWRRAS